MKSGTQKDLSVLMGVKPATVFDWKRRAKLKDLFLPDGRIDLEKAVKVLPGRVSIKHQQSINKRWKKITKKEIGKYKQLSDSDLSKLDIAELQRRFEIERVLMSRIKRAELEGGLISADIVRKEAAKCALQVKSAIMSIPDRISALLAAESNQVEVKKMLTKELRQALEGLSNQEGGQVVCPSCGHILQ